MGRQGDLSKLTFLCLQKGCGGCLTEYESKKALLNTNKTINNEQKCKRMIY